MRTLRRSSFRALTAGAVLGATGLLAACIPAPAAMPMIQTARVQVPSIPLAAVPNLALDAGTFDAGAAAACATGGPSAESAGFYRSALGRWAALRLATETTTLPEQQRLLGTLFTAGFFGGKDLLAKYGSQIDLSANGPFAAVTPMVKSASTAVIDRLAGQMLATANGDPTAVRAAATAMAPLVAQLLNALANPAVVLLPNDVQQLVGALGEVAQAAHAATTAAAAGDVAAARRAEATLAGVLVWAAGFTMGVAGQLDVATPTLTC